LLIATEHQVLPEHTMTANRRNFSRITFNNPIELNQDDYCWHAEIVDISLKGILLRSADGWNFNKEKPVQANIPLSEDTWIAMTLRVRHLEGDLAGFICENIDIDSIITLRRLVELNLGDSKSLERELAHLLQQAN
jgi:hypothetical protein